MLAAPLGQIAEPPRLCCLRPLGGPHHGTPLRGWNKWEYSFNVPSGSYSELSVSDLMTE